MTSPDGGRTFLDRIVPGLTGTAEIVVGPEHTAPFVGSGRIAVLATPVMINLIEAAALAAVEHLLPSGHQHDQGGGNKRISRHEYPPGALNRHNSTGAPDAQHRRQLAL